MGGNTQTKLSTLANYNYKLLALCAQRSSSVAIGAQQYHGLDTDCPLHLGNVSQIQHQYVDEVHYGACHQ